MNDREGTSSMCTPSADTGAATAAHTFATWSKQRDWTPLHVVRAEGCHFVDAAGRRYLDFSSQLVCSNLGHGNAAIAEAIAEQARRGAYLSPAFAMEVRAEAGRRLAAVMPGRLDRFFFSTSGTEANEAAFKIARAVTGRSKIISRYHSYHGSTAGSIAATGDHRRWGADPSGIAAGVRFAPDAYCYRCPFGWHYPACDLACAKYVEYMIEHEGDIAAVVVEPVVGTNGVLVPPEGYLARLREICTRRGVLLIADEVMTGWGRTGEWFAVNHWGVVPDILTTAKGVTGAYVPLGVTAVSRDVAAYFDDHALPHGHTYEGHPVALAAAVAAIREYQTQNLIGRAQQLGLYLGEQLRTLERAHPSIGDVRGIGLFWAIELTKDRSQRQPFNTRADKASGRPIVVNAVVAEAMRQGVYVMGWINHLVVAPPLIIAEEAIAEGVRGLDRALDVADALVDV